MKILSLNVRHGGGKRLPAICEYVARHDPDVFVATEHRNKSSLSSDIHKLGFQNQVAGDGDRNTVLVATKLPIVPVVHESRRLIGVQLESVTILGAYFAQKNEKRPLFEYLLALKPCGPTLLVGDFNTGEHFKDEDGQTFYCAELFAQLGDVGWFRLNPHEATWISNAGNGFCIDHAFAAEGLVGSASFDHSIRDDGLSDHSALHVLIE